MSEHLRRIFTNLCLEEADQALYTVILALTPVAEWRTMERKARMEAARHPFIRDPRVVDDLSDQGIIRLSR